MEEDEELRALEPDILRTKYPASKRKDMQDSDFCGPGRSFPILDAEDVLHASQRLHNAKGGQASIKKCVIGKAKAHGWPLPETWKDNKEDRGMDGEGLEHLPIYLPIVRYDEQDWTVTGQATVDEVDAYGTIFDYAASKRAFNDWRGNVREMHDSKRISVTTRVSRGAADTWQKVKDGVLTGYSVGALASKEDWGQVERNGKSVPLLKNYKLVELSLVDHPATPGCNIEIVRADGFANGEVLAEDGQPTEEQRSVEATDTRVGQRISHATQSDLHSLRDSHLMNAKKTMKICDCDECKGGCSALDPDDDGDIDLLPSLDYDQDGGSKDMNAGYRELAPTIHRALAPAMQRVNAMLARLSATTPQPEPQHIDTSAIEERLLKIEERTTGIADVRSLLDTTNTAVNEVKELAERIASQPQAGGPIANGAAMEKLLATQGAPSAPMNDSAVIQRAAQLGLLKTQESQMLGATAQIRDILSGR